jgi:predicted glycoside hydrolase/deacetylase ChbG (UPF0249 family)
MRVLITADDFGHSDDSVDATIDCFERGAITNASIMANMPATKRAIDYALAHPEYTFGVHLTFAGDGVEKPLCDAERLKALVDVRARFRATTSIRLRAVLRSLPQEQIELEMRAQLEFIVDHGVKVAYVDFHKHLHKFAPFRATLKQVLPRFSIRHVRNVQNIYVRKSPLSPTFWLRARWRRKISRDFVSTDYLFMPISRESADWWSQLPELPSGKTLEVGVHPGFAEDWRNAERLAVCRYADRVRGQGHALIDWRQV